MDKNENKDNHKKHFFKKRKAIPQLTEKIGEKIKSVKKIKLSSKVKKNIAVTASIALIGTAVLLNWLFFADGTDKQQVDVPAGQDTVDVSGENVDEDYFTSSQISRQRARDESIQVLQSIIYSDQAVEDVKNEAWEDISKIARNIEAEANIETLVVSKGIQECVAVVSDNAATVIVRSDGLQDNQITQIQEIVYEQANIPVENLKIIENNG